VADDVAAGVKGTESRVNSSGPAIMSGLDKNRLSAGGEPQNLEPAILREGVVADLLLIMARPGVVVVIAVPTSEIFGHKVSSAAIFWRHAIHVEMEVSDFRLWSFRACPGLHLGPAVQTRVCEVHFAW
jgi:hypothetical protein